MKGIIRSRKSVMNRQYNGDKKGTKWQNNGLQNILINYRKTRLLSIVLMCKDQNMKHYKSFNLNSFALNANHYMY
jgi:hypothetical protein